MSSRRRSDRDVRYRSTVLDRILAPARTVATVGPIEDLTTEGVERTLMAALSTGPISRVAVLPDAENIDWRYDTERSGESVVVGRDDDCSDLGRFLTTMCLRPGDRRALEVFVCGDYLLLDYSHGIGDGQFGMTALAVLARGDGTEQLAAGLPSNAIWAAIRRHYLAHPGRLRDVWMLRRQNGTPHDDSSTRRKRIANWQDMKCSVTAFMDPTQVEELRLWAQQRWPGATSASITIALWLAALRTQGVAVDDRVMILMNCRRYLDARYAGAQGNFAIGIPLLMPAPATPAAIATLVRRVVDSGWPIAILAVAQLKSALRQTGPPEVTSEVAEVPDRLRLAVSDIGRLPMFKGVRFGSGRPPQLAAFLEPDGPDAATLLVSELAGGRTLTASFCTAMIEQDAIVQALQRVCDDPVGLLAADSLSPS